MKPVQQAITVAVTDLAESPAGAATFAGRAITAEYIFGSTPDTLFPIRIPLVPSSDKEEPIGFLLVGPRPDGSIPSRDEQKSLKEVSESVARAIRTVIKREAKELQVTELIADNARRIDALEALLGASPLATGRRRPRSA